MKEGLELLCKLLPHKTRGIEIGSYAGESASIFMQSGKFEFLACVDPWQPGYYKNRQLEAAEKEFDAVTANFTAITKCKGTSDHWLKTFIEEKHEFNFIYIDGNHRYEAVKEDILLSLQILPKKSILAGHDYEFHKAPGVKKAVDEILGYPDLIFCDTSWLKFI